MLFILNRHLQIWKASFHCLIASKTMKNPTTRDGGRGSRKTEDASLPAVSTSTAPSPCSWAQCTCKTYRGKVASEWKEEEACGDPELIGVYRFPEEAWASYWIWRCYVSINCASKLQHKRIMIRSALNTLPLTCVTLSTLLGLINITHFPQSAETNWEFDLGRMEVTQDKPIILTIHNCLIFDWNPFLWDSNF